MSDSPTLPPKRLLLATDLSPRCDRALDRAAQLAAEWGAELAALNVLDSSAWPDQVLAWAAGADDAELQQMAHRQLTRDLLGLDVRSSVQVVHARDEAQAIHDAAQAGGAGLVVTGVARNEIFGRFLLGSTVLRLARSLPQPLLVVRDRSRGAYQRIVVATDLSEPSREALQTAARLFPGRELVLVHALERPLAGLTAAVAAAPVPPGAPASSELAAFLAATKLPPGTQVRTLVEAGAPETALAAHVRQHGVELVVMGSQGRGGLLGALLGSQAAKLLDWLPCDVMLVRASAAAPPAG